jgi:hypothetical protein
MISRGDRLRGWACRTRTAESVRELSIRNSVTTPLDFGKARRRRPCAFELRRPVLVNPNNTTTASIVTDLQAAAVTIGRQIEVLTAGTNHEIDTAFASLAQKRVDGLLVSPDKLFITRCVQLATAAMRDPYTS